MTISLNRCKVQYSLLVDLLEHYGAIFVSGFCQVVLSTCAPLCSIVTGPAVVDGNYLEGVKM